MAEPLIKVAIQCGEVRIFNMTIEKEDLKNWVISNGGFIPDEIKVNASILSIENGLNVKLPREYKDFLALTNDESCSPIDDKSSCLCKYNSKLIVVLVNVLSNSKRLISQTNMLSGSDENGLVNGLVAIGRNYDDDGDAYIIYDVRPNSPTYQHVFHWRYYVDNLVIGEGLGFLAHSLKEFLNTPTLEDEL